MLRFAVLALFVQTVVGTGQGGGGKPGGDHGGRPSPGKPTTSSPAVLLPTPQPSSVTRRRLVVFGDSFSDDGSGAWTLSDNTLPISPPYHEHSFSDGTIWAQMLAADQNLDLHNYAIGGATSDNSLVRGTLRSATTISVPSIADQIRAHLSSSQPRKGDVYTLWIGANDALASKTRTPAVYTLRNIDKQVSQLYVKGVRKIILASVPNLSTLPVAVEHSSSSIHHLSTFSRELKAGLHTVSMRWKSRVNIQVADIYSTFNQVLAKPQAYGFTSPNARIPCYSGSYHQLDAKVCENPSERIFFDKMHPSGASQKIIAQVFKAALENLK